MIKIKVELAAEWARLRKSSSVWFAGAWGVFFLLGPELINVWNQMPSDLKDALPQGTARWIGVAALATTFIARIVRVRKVQDQEAAKDGNGQ